MQGRVGKLKGKKFFRNLNLHFCGSMNDNKVNSGLPEVHAYINRGVVEYWSDVIRYPAFQPILRN
jgi:hypothetical protein